MAYDWLNYPGNLTLDDNAPINVGSGGNAVAPNYWTSKLTSDTGTITFDDATNTIELKTTTAGDAAQLRLTGLDTAIMNFEVEFEGIGSNPGTSNCRIIEFRNVGDTTYIGKLSLKTDGHLIWENAANATVWTSTNTIPTGAGWRVWVGTEKGTTASNGKIRISIYTASDGHSGTALETYSTDAGNTSTGNVGGVYLGWGSGGTLTLKYRYAEREMTTLAAPGPFTPSTMVVDWARTVRQVLDFSTTTGTNVSIDNVVQDSGPTVSTTIDNADLLVWFPDSAGRTTPIELTVTIIDSSNSEDVAITIPPNVRRVGPLIKIAGAWA